MDAVKSYFLFLFTLCYKICQIVKIYAVNYQYISLIKIKFILDIMFIKDIARK